MKIVHYYYDVSYYIYQKSSAGENLSPQLANPFSRNFPAIFFFSLANHNGYLSALLKTYNLLREPVSLETKKTWKFLDQFFSSREQLKLGILTGEFPIASGKKKDRRSFYNVYFRIIYAGFVIFPSNRGRWREISFSLFNAGTKFGKMSNWYICYFRTIVYVTNHNIDSSSYVKNLTKTTYRAFLSRPMQKRNRMVIPFEFKLCYQWTVGLSYCILYTSLCPVIV